MSVRNPAEMQSTKKKALKELYRREFEYISDLIDRAGLPHAEQDDSDSETEVTAKDASLIKFKGQSTEGNRAKSMEELHNRLAAIKAQKTTYRDVKLMNRLRSKLKRKKKMDENRTKQNKPSKIEKVRLSETNDKVKLKDVKPPKPIFNSNGNLVFSKFDFLGETAAVINENPIKNLNNKKRILENLEKNQNYLKKLEKVGASEKADQIRHETKWDNILRKSEGVRVKDDPQLLKKSLAKKQATKKASEKKWKERLEVTQNKKIEKQKKRKENIDKKILEKKKKKMKKAAKKGRYIPNV